MLQTGRPGIVFDNDSDGLPAMIPFYPDNGEQFIGSDEERVKGWDFEEENAKRVKEEAKRKKEKEEMKMRRKKMEERVKQRD